MINNNYPFLEQFAHVDVLYIFLDFRTGLVNFGENGHLGDSCQEDKNFIMNVKLLSKWTIAAVLCGDGVHYRNLSPVTLRCSSPV